MQLYRYIHSINNILVKYQYDIKLIINAFIFFCAQNIGSIDLFIE